MKNLTKSLQVIGNCMKESKDIGAPVDKVWKCNYAHLYPTVDNKELILCIKILTKRFDAIEKIEELEKKHQIDFFSRVCFMNDLNLKVNFMVDNNVCTLRFPQYTLDKYLKFLTLFQSVHG